MSIINRTQLNTPDKLDLLNKIIACQAHGAITLLTNEYSISQKAVYRARDAAQLALNELIYHDIPHQYITGVNVDKGQLRLLLLCRLHSCNPKAEPYYLSWM